LPWLALGGSALVFLAGGAILWFIFHLIATSTPTPEPPPHKEKQAGPPAQDPGVLTPAQAARRVNEHCTVQMTVRRAAWANNQKTFFLNSEMELKSPANFTVLSHQPDPFFAQNIPDPPTFYEGKTIRVSGVVTLYQKRAQIVVTDPSQIEVVQK
jgi:hypothetical protein